MNKTRLYKIIDQLTANINATIKDHDKTRLYITTWIIACGLNAIKEKSQATCYYWHKYTYKQLLTELKEYFYCLRIDEKIEQETREQLHTPENIQLLNELERVITK